MSHLSRKVGGDPYLIDINKSLPNYLNGFLEVLLRYD